MERRDKKSAILARLFANEELTYPAILAWPMTGDAECERQTREKKFLKSLENNLPLGLEWMRQHATKKYHPEKILENCRSVLVCALSYFRQDPIDSDTTPKQPSLGRVARYARGRDYHKELGKRLKRVAKALALSFPEDHFKAFTDIGPLDEVWLAEASGLGFRGQNTLMITAESGSWVVLGHILSTQPFPAWPNRPAILSCPPGCRRCMDACPTDALLVSGEIEAHRCIAYHSIEHRGPYEKEFRQSGGNRVFGCDICQEVCPFNRKVIPTKVRHFLDDIAGAAIPLAELLQYTKKEDFVSRFAGSPLMRTGRSGMLRNACTAAANQGDQTLVAALQNLLNDEDEGVREHAQWALDSLEEKSHLT